MRGCVVLVILAFSSELLAQSISEHPIDCPVAIIQANQEQPQCVEDEVVEKNESTSKWDAEIYFSGLVSTQLNKPLAPISLWGMHVGIPMTKHVQTGVWIDNPVLGDNLPSKLIQPARSSYSLQVEVQNFHKNDNSGVRIVFTHTSDHTVEELLEHVNNGFDQRSSGGEINTLGVGKKILINKQNQNDITVGWIDIDGHVNISRLIEIPGYLLADLNSTGVMIKSRHQYKFGKNDRHKVNSTLAHVTNVKKSADQIFPVSDYLLFGSSLSMHVEKIHPNLHLGISSMWAVPFRVKDNSDLVHPMLKKTMSRPSTYERPHGGLQFSLLFDLH